MICCNGKIVFHLKGLMTKFNLLIFMFLVLCFMSLCSYADEALEHYKKGELLFDKGDFSAAADCFKTIVEKHSTHEFVPVAYYSLGWAYLSLTEYDKAIDAFRNLIELFPEDNVVPDCYLILADCYTSKKDYKQSIQTIDEALSKYRDKLLVGKLNYKKAYNYFLEGNFENSLRILDNIKNIPVSREEKDRALFLRAYIAKKEGKEKDATKLLTQLVFFGESPEISNRALFLIAEIYDESGEKAKAVKYYSKVKTKAEILGLISRKINSLKRQRQEAWKSKVSPSKRMELSSRLNKLISKFKEVESGEDIGLVSYLRRALCYRLAGNIYRDIVLSRHIVEKVKDVKVVKEAYKELVYCYLSLVDIEKCVEISDSMVQRFPNDEATASACLSIGKKLFIERDYKNSINAFKKCVENSQDKEIYSEAKTLMAAAYMEEGCYDKAAQIYEDMLEYKEKYEEKIIPDVIFGLGVCLSNLGQSERAMSCFNWIIADYPSAAYARQALREKANIYFLKGNYKDAEENYKKYLSEYPDSKDILDVKIQIGTCLINLQRSDDAIKWLTEIDRSKIKDRNKKALIDFGIAQIHASNAKYKETEDKMLGIIKDYPDTRVAGECYAWLDKYYKNDNNVAAIINMYRIAAKSSKSRIDKQRFFFKAALLEQQVQNLDSAAKEYIEVVAIAGNENYYTCLSFKNLMNIILSQKEIKLGERLFERLKSKVPRGNSRDWKVAVIGLLTHGNLVNTGSEDDYLNLVPEEVEGKGLSAWDIYFLAEANLNLKKYSNAQGLFEMSLGKSEGDNRIIFLNHIGLSDVSGAENDWKKSLVEIEEALNIDFGPDTDMPVLDVRYKYANTLMQSGEYARSLKIWGKLLREVDKNRKPEILYRVAECYKNSGEKEKALRDFRKLSILHSYDKKIASKSLLACIALFKKLGREEEAKECYEELLKDYPDSEAALEAEEVFNGKT